MFAKNFRKTLIIAVITLTALLIGGTATEAAASTITVSGIVKDWSGNFILSPGVTVMLVGDETKTTTTSTTDGSFSLSGVPENTPFSLKFSKAGYLDVYTRDISSAVDMNLNVSATGSGVYNLPTAVDLTAFGAMPDTGKGLITGRVADATYRWSSTVGGVFLTATGNGGKAYPVFYRDPFGLLVRGGATFGNGRYYVLNVDGSDTVTLAASKSGWSFADPRVFTTHASGVSQGRITGTAPGYVTMSGSVINTAGAVIPGARLELNGDNGKFTNAGSGGAYAFSGLPRDANFYAKVTATDYVPTYAGPVNLSGNLSDINITLLTTAEMTGNGVTGNNGMLTCKVIDTSMNPLSGATVLLTSKNQASYNVVYSGGGSATNATGVFVVPNIQPGDTVKVSVTKAAGYAFAPVYLDGFASAVTGSLIAGALPVAYSSYISDKDTVGISGVTVEQVGASPANTATSSTSPAGAYTLNNVPSSVPFYLKFSKAGAGYADTYTAEMTRNGAVNEGLNDGNNLFLTTQLNGWNGGSGKGLIRSRVKDSSGNYIAGATVLYTSSQGRTYTICYDDACTSTLTSTQGSSGRYMVKDVETGDTVTVTARKAGYTFNTRVFHTVANSVHQGGITGAVQSIVSYNSFIQDQSGVGIGGATVEQVGASPANTTTSADGTGAFVLNVSSGVPFYVKLSKAGFADTYSAEMTLSQNYYEVRSYSLFTPDKLASWGIFSGKGIIRTTVRDQAGNPLGGAVVTVHSQQGYTTYTVCYDDACSGLTSTVDGSGRYIVKNVEPGDTVTVTAQKAGYTFNTRVFHTCANSLHQGGITGAVQSIVSYSGYVMDTASPNIPISGATIEQMGATPPNTTTSITDGSYTLTGLPAGTPFHLKFTKDGFTPTYTANMAYTVNIVSTVDQAFNLFPANQLSTWVIDAGKGIIRTRVRDQARNYIGGVVISATSQFGQTYTVCYDDACSGLTSTAAASGWFIVRNVLPGDLVTVTASKAGWTFNSRIYHTYAGGISQGGITGSGQDPTADEQAIRNGFVTAIAYINAGNAAGFITFVSSNYLNDGETRTDFETKVQELITAGGQIAYALGTISIQGDMATVPVTWTMTIGGQQEVNPETLIFKKENGAWLIYGNQQRHGVRANSQHWANGYYASFNVDDHPGITAVTVAGPGMSTLNLVYHEGHGWWNDGGGPFIGTAPPSTPPTYTFTVYEGAQSYTYERPITGWVQEFATNLFPAGQAGGPVVFTWTGISGAANYAVELNDNSYNRLWSKYNIPPTQTWAIYDGTALESGKTYIYWVSSRDADENASFAEGQFIYNGATGISFTGQVTAAANGAALPGVAVTLARNPNSTPSATSDASGNFTLYGAPQGSHFTVMMAKAGYLPTYTAIFRSQDPIVASSAPYGLYTPTDTATWPVNFVTKGAIATRVVDPSGNFIAGAIVTAHSMLRPDVPYTVTYRNDAGNFGGTATYGNGRFYVLGVDEGDIVTVTAVKSGYTFQARIFYTRSGGISQGRITGTVGLFGGDVNHDGRLTLADAIMVLQVAAGIPAAVYIDADVNGDGRIDLAELIYILQSLAGLR